MPKRDYHKSKYSAQREQRMKIEKEKKSFKNVIFIVIFLAIIAGIIYWLFFSAAFRIKQIQIAGTDQAGEMAAIENMAQDFMEHKRFYVLSQRNPFVLSKSGLKNLLSNKFDLDTVKVDIEWPSTLTIDVKYKMPALIWQEGENYFTIYNDGIVKNKLSNVMEFELPLVNRGTTTVVDIGNKYVSEDQLNYIQKLFSLFNFYFKDIGVQQFVLTSLESREVKLITSQGWYIIFSIDDDAQEILEIVKAVLEQKVGEGRPDLEYIDARLKDKIYYK